MNQYEELHRWREDDLDDALLLELSSKEPSETHIRDLVAAGADVNSVGRESSVLMEAIDLLQDGLDPRFVELLVELGADINHVTKYEWCALANLVFLPNAELMEFLLQNGGNPNVILENSETVLDVAEIDHSYETMESWGDPDSPHGRHAALLDELIAVLKKYGAKSFYDLWADEISLWLNMGGFYPTGLQTATGNINIEDVPRIDEALAQDFRKWKDAYWDPWPGPDASEMPQGFDRAEHNAWGRRLAQHLRPLVPEDVPLQYRYISAEDERYGEVHTQGETIS